MAAQYWQNLSVMFGEYDFAARAKTVEAPTVTVTDLDVTPLSTTGWTEVIGGLTSVDWSADVMADFDTDQVDQLLGLSGSNWAGQAPLSIMPAGITTGSLAYTFRANQFNYTPISGDVGDLAMGTLGGKARQGPVVRGQLLVPSAAYTTSATGTSAQLGAVSATQTLYAALHVLTVTGGTPTLDAVVRSDNDTGMGTPTTQITFAQATAAGWQWGSAAGAITDDWYDVDFTIGGSTPSFTFACVVGIAATV